MGEEDAGHVSYPASMEDAREIAKDTKDWTWVLERPCPDCGADVRRLSPDGVAAAVRDSLPQWTRLLERSVDELRRRPAPQTWSPLEYAAHVRDVFGVMHERLRLMLDRQDPTFPDWDQDDAAAAGDYRAQDPRQVAAELEPAGRRLAAVLEAVAVDQQGRRGLRGDGSEFTVVTLAQYAWHDVAHHLWDVGIDRG